MSESAAGAPLLAKLLTSSHRLEAFCDAVMAVAITLLVLEMKVPSLSSPTATSLAAALQHLWPLLLATVLSFVAIGCYWLNQHQFFRALRGVDHRFILITLAWLLSLCMLPFTTAVVGETMLHGDSVRVSAPLYLLGLALASITWGLGWWYACAHGLLRPEVTASVRQQRSWQYALSSGAHLLWCGLSLWWPWLALTLGTVQTLLYMLPQRPLIDSTT
jgi:uncharacterized membrane protein